MLGLAAVALAGLPVVLAPVLAGLATAATRALPAEHRGDHPAAGPRRGPARRERAAVAVGMGAIAAGPVSARSCCCSARRAPRS